jgi:ATP-dependent 26S proteasome regulatory subunit
VLLQGKTGTGKTKMVSMIAKRIGIELVSIRTSMLGNSYEDSDFINLKETILPLIKSGKPYIIALEDFGNLRIKSLDWLCGVIGCENILFIFITDKKVGSLDQRFVNSQICKKIEVQLPDKNSRRQIIEYTLARKKKNLNEGRANLNYDSLDLVEIADKTNNFNIFSLNGLLENTFDDAFDLAYKDTSSDEILKIVITKKIFSEQFDKMQKTRKRYGAVEDEN